MATDASSLPEPTASREPRRAKVAIVGQTLGHEFVRLDDDVYVANNAFVRDGFSSAGLWRAWGSGYEWN